MRTARATQEFGGEDGYAMVALLVGLSIMSVALSVALPAWSTMARREREAELIFRGEQYARAIQLYQRKFANSFPPSIDLLVDQKFLRRKYKDPITGEDFTPVAAGNPIAQQAQTQQTPAETTRSARGVGTPPFVPARGAQPQGRGGAPQGNVGGGGAGLIGVVSKSEKKSLRLYNGRDQYNQWVFVAQQATTQAGAPGGGQRPGGPGQRGPNGPDGRGPRTGLPGPPAPLFPGRGAGQPPGR
jgi:type II secretory pathway pseudopilin PulG